jgi:hypothetical protein
MKTKLLISTGAIVFLALLNLIAHILRLFNWEGGDVRIR